MRESGNDGGLLNVSCFKKSVSQRRKVFQKHRDNNSFLALRLGVFARSSFLQLSTLIGH